MKAGLPMALDFSDIRPYIDAEVGPVIEQLRQSSEFAKVLALLVPNRPTKVLLRRMHGVDSVAKFQTEMMGPVVDYIMARSTDGVSVEYLEPLEPDRQYVFISNHRDIFLDSALLGRILHRDGHDTPQMAIGDNLMMNDWMTHLFKINKTVVVKRGLSQRELFRASKKLSAYIGRLIKHGPDSFWIAQQEGRAKDGNDHTHPGVIKMLALDAKGHPGPYLRSLNLVPVSLSYEWDPCDVLKSRERLQMARQGFYDKAEGEDFNSITQGIFGAKGRVHLVVGRGLKANEAIFDTGQSKHETAERVAEAVDREIISNYRLWPSHHIAADMLAGCVAPGEHYSQADLEQFQGRLQKRLQDDPDGEGLRAMLLEMYANPVRNAKRL